MSVFKTAYDTTACKDYLMTKTGETIDRAQIDGQLKMVEGSKGIYEVQGGSSVADAIPAFAHPMAFLNNENMIRVVTDMRHFGKWDQHQNLFHVRNAVDYKFNQLRAKLTYVFCAEPTSILRDISPVPMTVFAMWISEAISRRFALDPQEQMLLAVLSAVYYNSLFTDAEEFTEREKMAMVNTISRNLKVAPDVVMENLEKIPVIKSVAHFCDFARELTQSVRLEDLNTGLLYAIVGSAFARNDWRETIAVALEHPPTWIALCMVAVTERTYKHTVVTKITERASLRNETATFARAVSKMADTLSSH